MFFSGSTYPSLNKETSNKIVLLPLGAIEQHGLHLPVSTDTDIVTAVATYAESKLPDDILLCPTLAYGSSHHHQAFGGTLSVSPQLYTQLVIEIVESVIKSGFTKIILLNGHGGNITPVKQALSVLSNRYDATINPTIALATYWELAGITFAGEPPMQSPALSHACEYETSLMLHLFPGNVLMEKVQRAARPESNGYIAWEDDEPYRGVTVVKQTEFVSGNGCSGEPQLATKEKGQHLFEHATKALLDFIVSFKNWPTIKKLKP
ncbi:creatininase family protein [Ferruginibacter paludis]|uniref:creatininase family protein n=1 Tax=Ferruginibacter paludis TaxID=1310417 RepID=UPI0025B46434|nr:creatininase family protein [Ferruginibacter paludis]MDN3656847.1 creatininase family protein [Ferruginibacter paludis]